MAALIDKAHGRVVDSPGDNLLAEFASVVDAVHCAVTIQQVLKSHNAELTEDHRMRFRIGINLGDVIEDGDRIYGDGINIAARLESLAEPGGGICISGTVYDQVKNKLALEYDSLGEQSVKNIADPVRTYRVNRSQPDDVRQAGSKKRRCGALLVQKSRLPLFAKILITCLTMIFVMPFVNSANLQALLFLLIETVGTCLLLYVAFVLTAKTNRVKWILTAMSALALVLIITLAMAPILFGLANFLLAALVFIPLCVGTRTGQELEKN